MRPAEREAAQLIPHERRGRVRPRRSGFLATLARWGATRNGFRLQGREMPLARNVTRSGAAASPRSPSPVAPCPVGLGAVLSTRHDAELAMGESRRGRQRSCHRNEHLITIQALGSMLAASETFGIWLPSTKEL